MASPTIQDYFTMKSSPRPFTPSPGLYLFFSLIWADSYNYCILFPPSSSSSLYFHVAIILLTTASSIHSLLVSPLIAFIQSICSQDIAVRFYFLRELVAIKRREVQDYSAKVTRRNAFILANSETIDARKGFVSPSSLPLDCPSLNLL